MYKKTCPSRKDRSEYTIPAIPPYLFTASTNMPTHILPLTQACGPDTGAINAGLYMPDSCNGRLSPSCGTLPSAAFLRHTSVCGLPAARFRLQSSCCMFPSAVFPAAFFPPQSSCPHLTCPFTFPSAVHLPSGLLRGFHLPPLSGNAPYGLISASSVYC